MKELEEQNTDLTEKVKELEEKNKEPEEQPVDLDSALFKAVLSQLSEQEAKKSFKKIASTQLPQQEVMGAWFEQLDSEQQLIFSSLSISLGNFMVKHAAFKEGGALSEQLLREHLAAWQISKQLADQLGNSESMQFWKRSELIQQDRTLEASQD